MNKHTDLIREYAEDWANNAEPWTLWEVCSRGYWEPLAMHPSWSLQLDYRRKLEETTLTFSNLTKDGKYIAVIYVLDDNDEVVMQPKPTINSSEDMHDIINKLCSTN